MSKKSEQIMFETVNVGNKSNEVVPMLVGEIAGATVFHHTMLKGSSTECVPKDNLLHIFFLIQGEARFCVEGKSYSFTERSVFVPSNKQQLTITASSDMHLLEIQWELNEEDIDQLSKSNTVFPITQIYASADQYKDFFKSEKTISRSLIGQHALPRFCMGSVESYGFDRVEPHAHPLLDQFFFSFPENDMELLIDDERQPMEGNTLLHIPLGSNHGVEVVEGKRMHYIWIDFIIDKKGVDYLDEVHKATGTQRSFEEK